MNWFVERDIPANITGRLLRHHGDNSVEAIQSDPYRLMNFGMSWKECDALAQKRFHIEPEDVRRQAAAVEDSLIALTKKGHTVAARDDLYPMLHNRLRRKSLAEAALDSDYESKRFVRDDQGLFHVVGIMVMERVVSMRLQKLAGVAEEYGHEHNGALHEAIKTLPYPLTERQKDAVVQGLVNGISVITGGAGTGKTTVLRVVMNAYKALGYHIYPMALSGRAAMRIKESTGYPSRTIAGFLKNENLKELEKNLIVIDEASMVDLPTMYRIITSIPDTVRLLLVGDAGQLQPIGPGLILHDIVQSRALPVTELDIVKRQDSSSGIPEYTRLIKTGLLPDLLSVGNIRFHETAPEAMNSKILKLYSESPDTTQIVAATYKASHGGIDSLNQQCQTLMNPGSPPMIFELYGGERYLPFRLNDPVIFTENDWDADVQNGSLGKLISIEQTGEHFGAVLLDTGRTVDITERMLDSLRLAYAISLHKAQGSQFPRVIVPITLSRMIDRTWVYTALTRAETHIEIVGEREQLQTAISHLASSDRKTWLKHLLSINT